MNWLRAFAAVLILCGCSQPGMDSSVDPPKAQPRQEVLDWLKRQRREAGSNAMMQEEADFMLHRNALAASWQVVEKEGWQEDLYWIFLGEPKPSKERFLAAKLLILNEGRFSRQLLQRVMQQGYAGAGLFEALYLLHASSSLDEVRRKAQQLIAHDGFLQKKLAAWLYTFVTFQDPAFLLDGKAGEDETFVDEVSEWANSDSSQAIPFVANLLEKSYDELTSLQGLLFNIAEWTWEVHLQGASSEKRSRIKAEHSGIQFHELKHLLHPARFIP